MKPNAKLLSVVSDLLINLSAGWFGAIFIIPVFSGTDVFLGAWILTGDLVMGILFLYLSYRLRLLIE